MAREFSRRGYALALLARRAELLDQLASKAAMQAFLESARVELAPLGVRVTTVNPGFIATPMTEKNTFRMPFLMQAEAAARIIVDGIERGARVVEFPRPVSMAMRFARLLPSPVYDRVMRLRR